MEISMNFYIGDTLEEISHDQFNIIFTDELIQYIYCLSKQSTYDMVKLYSINPYSDVSIPYEDLSEIIEICNQIIKEDLLSNYREYDAGMKMLTDLINISQSALADKKGLISVGD